MIALKELKLINFRSWKELHIKDFNKKGLCLISGINGSGKSSIRMAIEYLILDKTSDGISVEDMPRDASESCELFGRFDFDGKEVKITKYRSHTQFANQTHVEYDGDNSLTANDRRITQKNIEKLFDVTPPLLFTSTIFTVNSPSFVESLEADRKKLLYSILPLDVYNELYLVATGKTKLIKARIDKYNNDIVYTAETVQDLDAELSDLAVTHTGYRDNIKHEISLLRDQQDLCVPESATEIEDKIVELINNLVEVDVGFVDLIKNRMSKIQSQIQSLLSDRRYVQSNLDNISDGTCPILNINCKDLVDNSIKTAEKYEPELHSINNEIKSLRRKLELLKSDLDTAEKDLKQSMTTNSNIRMLEKAVFEIERNNDQKKERYKELETRCFVLGNQDNPYTDMIEKKTARRNELAETLHKMQDKVVELTTELEYCKYFEVAFSKAGIPNMKADGFLESIEYETNRYLSAVSDRMFVEIKGQTAVGNNLREKIDYNVRHPEKSITNYKSFSGGERQRVKVADLFAFHSLISKFNFIFLDEVLEGSIDTKGKVEILSLLRMKAQEVDSLLVVSHDDTIKDAFDNIMEVKNVDGISTLE